MWTSPAQLAVMRELPQRHRRCWRGVAWWWPPPTASWSAALLHSLDGIGSIVGAASTEAEALACLSSTAADLLICSDQLERGNGPSLVAAAKARQPGLRCLMLIRRPLLSTIQAAAAADCDGLCSHERIGNGGLLSVLHAMESDGSHMDPVIAGVAHHNRHAAGGCHPLSDVLSLREEDALRGLCEEDSAIRDRRSVAPLD